MVLSASNVAFVAARTREISEIFAFSFMSKVAFFAFFVATPWHVVVFSAIAACFVVSAGVEVYHWLQARRADNTYEFEMKGSLQAEDEFQSLLNPQPRENTALYGHNAIVMTLAAAAVAASVVGSLLLGVAAFTAGPWLFLAAMALLLELNIVKFAHTCMLMQEVKAAEDQPDFVPDQQQQALASYHQELVKLGLTTVFVGLVTALIVGVMVVKFAPVVVLAIAMAAVGLNAGMFFWGLFSKLDSGKQNRDCEPISLTQGIKHYFGGFFDKQKYQPERPPSPAPLV